MVSLSLFTNFLFKVYDRKMTSSLAKIIIEQFFCIVDETAKRCCICWDKCLIKIVTRLHVDQLVIEIFRNDDDCGCDNKNTISSYLPLPLITIDFTNIKHKNIKCDKWIRYLEIKASELLNKLEAAKGELITNLCCPPRKSECVPVNNCNCTFREEYRLCPCKPCKQDKPYDDWCKPCKQPKKECPCYKEPKCPIKHRCTENYDSDSHKKCDKPIKCKPVKLFKCEDNYKIYQDDYVKCDNRCKNEHKKCEPIKCKLSVCEKNHKCQKCGHKKHNCKCDYKHNDHKKYKFETTDSDSDKSELSSLYELSSLSELSTLSELSSLSESINCSDLLNLCDKFCLSESIKSSDSSDKKHHHKCHECGHDKHKCKCSHKKHTHKCHKCGHKKYDCKCKY